MRYVTIATVLALLALALLAGGCPRKAGGDQTNVAIDETTPDDKVVATTDGEGAEGGDTKVEVEVNQGDATADAAQAEGDKTADASGDKAEGDAAGDAGKTEDKPAEPAKEDPNVTKVVFETSKGDIVMAVHSDWAPIGAQHFLDLVQGNYYNGAPWFRVIPGFVAQCGIAADPAMTKKWQDQTIQDEPVKQGNKRGFVSFGKSGAPNSRSTHIFINYADNGSSGPRLDSQGFSAFAEVVEGMDVADKLFPAEFQDQQALSEGGIEAFKKMFPQGDTIIRAYVKE